MPRKRSDAAVNEELKRRLEEIEARRQHAQKRGLAFASPSEEELAKKIRGESTKSPYFYFASWNTHSTPGTASYYEAGYANPDPGGYYPVVTIFFGLANIAADISEGFDARDSRWPYVSSEPAYLAPGATATASFNYKIPNAQAGTYLGNAVLWEPRYFDVGSYFERGFFDVTVV